MYHPVKFTDDSKMPALITTGGINRTQLAAAQNYGTSTYTKLDMYDSVCAVAILDAVGAEDTFTLTLLQATSAAGAGAKAFGTAATTTTSTAGTVFAVAEVARNLDVDGGFCYVGARIAPTTGDEGHYAEVLLFKTHPRERKSSMPA
jgi:hypothetical protein